MSEENYNVEIKNEKHHECFCHSKWFKKFLLTTLGSFLGFYFALCLFTAMHKPPMPGACPCGCGCPIMRGSMHHHHHFDRSMGGDFHRKMMKECGNKRIPVKVEIED